jgi:hypothetical protein
MNTDLLFKELEPPPGGAERFARRLDEIAAERPSLRARAGALAAAAAAVAVGITALLLQPVDDAPELAATDSPPPVEVYGAPEFDRLLGRPPRPTELTVLVNTEATLVTELTTTSAKVRIYQIN